MKKNWYESIKLRINANNSVGTSESLYTLRQKSSRRDSPVAPVKSLRGKLDSIYSAIAGVHPTYWANHRTTISKEL
jgi:hypothetical protein